jgi:hypothetical protein
LGLKFEAGERTGKRSLGSKPATLKPNQVERTEQWKKEFIDSTLKPKP